uniref:VP11 n=1 Tax=viral metagenome TaxID=1070528 RepID=A0A2V0R9W4_9ZZZZ
MSGQRRRPTITANQFETQWTAAEIVLTRVKHSCMRYHLQYRKRYLLARARLMYYDVPIIVLSSVNSVFIAGGKNFLPSDAVEITTCMLALGVGIIQALKTFLKVDENRENCLVTYKDLFRLFCELSIMLDQPRETRGVDPQKFMADKNSEYKEIMNKAIVLEDNKVSKNPIYFDRHPLEDASPMDSPRRMLSLMNEQTLGFPRDATSEEDISESVRILEKPNLSRDRIDEPSSDDEKEMMKRLGLQGTISVEGASAPLPGDKDA